MCESSPAQSRVIKIKIMTIKQKVSRARNIAVGIINSGMRFLQRTADINPRVYTMRQVIDFMETQELKSYSLADQNYNVEKWSKLREIIANDWTDAHKYYKDKYDCENFAATFASRMPEYYGLNGMGLAFGAVYDKNGKKKWGHGFNLILARNDNDELQLYLFEPQTDAWTEYKPGKKLWIDRMGEYRINWAMYY